MNRYSIQRVWYVLRHMVVVQRRNALISFGAVFGALAAIVLISAIGGFNPEIHTYLAGAYLFVVGIVVTSTGFGELHDGRRSYAYLMLPASPAEKVTAVVIATALLWIPIALVSYALFSLLMSGLTLLVFGTAAPLFNPFAADFAELIGTYVVAHALFLFGAVYFRGKNLVKTVASLAALGFGVFAVVGTLGWLLFDNASAELERVFMNPAAQAIAMDSLSRLAEVFAVLVDVLDLFVSYVLPPALWLLTWQRFRETEVAHGV